MLVILQKTLPDVTLQLGETTNLNIILKDASAQLTEVVVKGTREGERQGAGISVGSESIRRLPTISRSLTDMTRLSPQANNNNSFAGTNFRYNNVTVDGAVNNDAIGLVHRWVGRQVRRVSPVPAHVPIQLVWMPFWTFRWPSRRLTYGWGISWVVP